MAITLDGTTGITTPGVTDTGNLSYTGTLTGGTGVVNIGSGQVYKDASGNVGIGVTPSAWGSPFKAIDIGAYASFSGTTTGATVVLQNAYFNGTSYIYKNSTDNALRYTQGSGTHYWHNAPVGTAGNAITFTQAMTLDASGNLLVGATSSNPISARVNGNVLVSTGGFNSRAPVSTRDWAISATSGSVINFYSDNGSTAVYAGSINVNGNVTTYASVSDYRLKENVQPMTGALAKVQALNPVTYTFKDGGQVSQGFIAHELQSVIPDAVTGEKDAVKEDGSPAYQGVDVSFLIATLTAAIQEQQALISSLTTRLTALENK